MHFASTTKSPMYMPRILNTDYKELLPNANFITANFVTAIFQNPPLCNGDGLCLFDQGFRAQLWHCFSYYAKLPSTPLSFFNVADCALYLWFSAGSLKTVARPFFLRPLVKLLRTCNDHAGSTVFNLRQSMGSVQYSAVFTSISGRFEQFQRCLLCC